LRKGLLQVGEANREFKRWDRSLMLRWKVEFVLNEVNECCEHTKTVEAEV
jgi:hypothetical protein